jgi:hypothetical protein
MRETLIEKYWKGNTCNMNLIPCSSREFLTVSSYNNLFFLNILILGHRISCSPQCLAPGYWLSGSYCFSIEHHDKFPLSMFLCFFRKHANCMCFIKSVSLITWVWSKDIVIWL